MALAPGQIIAALAPLVGRAGAAGVAGNTMQESTNRPEAPGGGLFQEQGPRWQGQVNYARAHGLNPNSAAAALGYLRQDFSGPYAGLAAQLRRTKDPGQAAVLFSKQYERPGTPMNENRVRYARAAYGAPMGAVLPGLGAPGKGQRSLTMVPTSRTLANSVGGGLNTEALAQAVLAKEASRPITSGLKGNPLADYVHAQESGAFNLPATPTKTKVPGDAKAVYGAAQGGALRLGSPLLHGAGNVNPLGSGWHLGRTDQGVDASAAPGTPIHAINDSRVVAIQPNWYAGQPLVLLKLTAGPDAGKYWYVSEQINHGLHVGQTVGRGQTVATFAHAGTGIEIGWGDPHSGGLTLAQAQGNTGDAHHNNAPAGIDFRRRVLRG